MKLDITTCVEGDYSDSVVTCEITKRVLFYNGASIEVNLITKPEVSGHSLGKLNVLFRDKSKDKNDDTGKYFAHVSFAQKQMLIWMFGKYWIQDRENYVKIILVVSGFALSETWHFIRNEIKDTEEEAMKELPKPKDSVSKIGNVSPVLFQDTPVLRTHKDSSSYR